jgi:hypothetical protein
VTTRPRKAAAKKAPARSAAAQAQQAEAGDGFATVEKCGLTLRIPVGANIPAEVIDIMMEGGQFANRKALRAIVGERQWKQLIDKGMTEGDVKELDETIGALLGN